MFLRIGIFGALFFSVFWGIVDTFIDPTPENAAKILQPSEERIATSKSLVDPFLAWANGLTPDAVVQLVKDADADVRAKLQDNPLPLQQLVGGVTEPVPAEPVAAPAAATEEGGAAVGATNEAGDPGLSWYTEGGLEQGPP